MKICKRFFFITALLFCLTQTGSAFDSDRQGLVLIGGIGAAPIAYNEISNFSDSRLSTPGYALSFSAGYGYNENTMFLFTWEAVKTNTFSSDSEAESVWQGFSGGGVRFYFGDIGSSFFISSAIGIQFYNAPSSSEFAHNSGLGVLVGVGQEITEHFQIQANLSNGETRDSFKWHHMQLIVTGSFILF